MEHAPGLDRAKVIEAMKPLKIEFLYLDLTSCDRCLGTEKNLSQAIDQMSDYAHSQGRIIELEPIEISSAELAIKHHFYTSPTIRIDSQDIQGDFLENDCACCGDICGTEVDCRSWHYEGQAYDVPPIGLITSAIRQAIDHKVLFRPAKPAYVLPENLERYFSALANKKGKTMKPKVAFICVHNSCRSQMAEALSKLYASDVYEAYSAGTETKPQINQDAVRIIKDKYGIDMNETQHSKLIDEIPEVDIVVTMGCNVICPYMPSQHEEDWGLDDPTGQPDEAFIKTVQIIEDKVKDLARRISGKEIELS